MAEAGFPGGLDPRLAADSLFVADLPLCQVRLQNDARWPWLVLIPRASGLVELEDLSASDRAQLMEEAVAAGAAVRAVGEATGFTVEKLNVGALGNVVRQLHVHIIGRRTDDAAGAAPVWGLGTAAPYAPQQREAALGTARHSLGG
jgi:diadenosine tetraphosphate (Ap4A) HIT family hydrolase